METPTKSVQDQLASIISHIEDLEEVNERVIVSDDTKKYNEPLLSEESELRFDFWNCKINLVSKSYNF